MKFCSLNCFFMVSLFFQITKLSNLTQRFFNRRGYFFASFTFTIVTISSDFVNSKKLNINNFFISRIFKQTFVITRNFVDKIQCVKSCLKKGCFVRFNYNWVFLLYIFFGVKACILNYLSFCRFKSVFSFVNFSFRYVVLAFVRVFYQKSFCVGRVE